MDDRRTLTRRDFLRLSAVAATGAVVVACAPAAPEVVKVEKEVPVEKVVVQTVEVEKEVPAKPAAKAEIEWWHGWGGMTGVNAMQAVADAFNVESETIYVHRLQVSSISDKYMTAIAGGAPPDVEIGNLSYSSFWARGVITPLDDWVNASDVIVKEDIFPSSWVEASWQGKIYGVPTVESYLRFALCYHEALVKEAGLDPGTPPETWDEAFEWHEKMNKFDSAGNLEILGFDPMDAMGGSGPGPPDPFFWPQSYGFKWWTSEDNKFHFDDPGFVAALTTIKRFYDSVGVEKMAGYRSSYGTWTESPTASFPAGVQAMIVNGYWTPGELVHAAPGKKIIYTWPPNSSERRGIKFQSSGGHFGNIPKGSPNPEAAFEFLEFTTTDKACDIIFAQTGWLGARLSYLEKVDTSKAPGLDFYIRSATEADEMNACACCPISGFVGDQWWDTVDAVNYGDKTPEEAAKDLQKLCTDELRKSFPELAG